MAHPYPGWTLTARDAARTTPAYSRFSTYLSAGRRQRRSLTFGLHRSWESAAELVRLVATMIRGYPKITVEQSGVWLVSLMREKRFEFGDFLWIAFRGQRLDPRNQTKPDGKKTVKSIKRHYIWIGLGLRRTAKIWQQRLSGHWQSEVSRVEFEN